MCVIENGPKLLIAPGSAKESQAGAILDGPVVLERIAAGAAEDVVAVQHQLFERLRSHDVALKWRTNRQVRVGSVETYFVPLPRCQISERAADAAETYDPKLLFFQGVAVQKLRLKLVEEAMREDGTANL